MKLAEASTDEVVGLLIMIDFQRVVFFGEFGKPLGYLLSTTTIAENDDTGK